MEALSVFVSVGGPSTPSKRHFFEPSKIGFGARASFHTVGRNTFSSDAPLKTVTELLDKCAGTVVIALERSFFPTGLEKRGGPKQSQVADIKLPTPWNQIEAAMAYSRGHPLLVIVEQGLKSEGLLEHGYDWHVQWVEPVPSALTTLEFNGVLAGWKSKMESRRRNAGSLGDTICRSRLRN